MFEFMVVALTLIVFACGVMWLVSGSLKDWAGASIRGINERPSLHKRARRRAQK